MIIITNPLVQFDVHVHDHDEPSNQWKVQHDQHVHVQVHVEPSN